MAARAVTAGRIVELVLIFLAIGYQVSATLLIPVRLLDLWCHYQDVRHMGNERDGLKVFNRVVGELLEKVRIDGMRGDGSDTQRLCRRASAARQIGDAAVAAGAGLVVNDDVAEILVYSFGDGAS